MAETDDTKSKKAATRARVRPVDAKTEKERAKALASKSLDEYFGTGDPDAPKRVGLHGESGSGKTTFLAGVPGIVFLPIEQGINQAPDLPRYKGALDTYDDFMNALAFLRHSTKHSYKAIGIETMADVERLLVVRAEDRLADTNGGSLASLNENEAGAGYDMIRDEWFVVLNYLDDIRKTRGMHILTTFPTRATRVPSIDHTPEFFRYEPHFSMSTKARALVKGWLDYQLFFKVDVTAAKSIVTKKVVGNMGGGHSMYFTQKGSHDAKCRGLVKWPESAPLTIEDGWATFDRVATLVARHGRDLAKHLADDAARATLHLPGRKGPVPESGDSRRMNAMSIVFKAIEAGDWFTACEVIAVADAEMAEIGGAPAAAAAPPAVAAPPANGAAAGAEAS